VTARRKAEYVQPVVSEARVARIWAAVEDAKLHRPRARRNRFIAASLALGIAAAVAVALPSIRHRETPTTTASAGLVVDTHAEGDRITLADGSIVTLGPETRLAIVDSNANAIRLRLERGHVECDVTHRPGRSFVVDASTALVEVKGTLFSVERSADDTVAVRVERGSVEVKQHDPQPVAVLTPGQTWSSRAAAAVSAAPSPEPSSAPPTRTIASSKPARESARALFDRANASRVGGRMPEAASAFDELWRHYPNDGHAAIAAFESGRIQLDTMGDARAATASFSFAASHGEGAFREDAEARLVEALARSGDRQRCKKARETFLARYPASAHRSLVAASCP
jgi:transmembrane sensor